MSNKITNAFLGGMQKFAMQRHVVSIRDGMIGSLAVSLIGSFFLIIRFLPIPAWSAFMDSHAIGTYLLYPVAATMDMLGLVILIGIAYRLAENYKLEPLGAVITAISCYMVVNPLNILVDVPELAKQMSVSAVPISILGTKGLFVAILIGVFSVEIYRKIIDANLVITMPDSVPPAVAKSFMAVIPTLSAILVMLVVRVFFENTSYGTLSAFIEKTLSSPLKAGVRSIWGGITHQMLFSVFFSMGIHGAVLDSVYLPAWTVIMDENRQAFQAGLALPNVMTQQYLEALMKLGGTGSTMAFVVLSLFRAKSNHLKQVSRLSIAPAIFQINEPIIFGVPVVLNPVMMIPFIIVPGILAANSFIWVDLGLVARPTGVAIPWTMPSIINVYLQTNGDFKAIILQLVNFVISLLIYYPFFKIIDRDYFKNEEAKK